MRYISYIIEGSFMLAHFTMFAIIITFLTVLIIKKVWGVKVDNTTLAHFIIILLLGLLVAQYIGIALWYGPISTVVDEADPFISFMTFNTLSWEPIFGPGTQLFHRPIGSFHTTGQIANLYYGLAIVLSLISLGIAGFLLYLKNKAKRQLILMIGSTIFILQTAIMGIKML